ncbi:MAG TPA: 5'-3' exonuclease H3TH domain-containing protein [Dehalococcoidia bacterium]|nr:5'-3' exonuclease H3TH domain-containing protein [Dehalococcoidia bacterium]
MKVHLIDGTYELFRCFYGAPRALAPDGSEVGATRGLLATLLRLLREDGVTHVAVAFDRTIESFRNDLFAGYKTGAGIDPDLWRQAPLAERAAHALGFTVWPMAEFEADDAMASAAARYAALKPVEQVVLATPDKDLAQCVRGDRVVLWDRRRQRTIDEDGVIQNWGVAPASIPDYLALVGDAADGIPGIRGWGARSSAAVLLRYHHLEAIPDDAADWDVPVRAAVALAERLRDERGTAMLYRTLATLREDVPLDESLDELRWLGADRGELASLCEEIGATAVLERVARWR